MCTGLVLSLLAESSLKMKFLKSNWSNILFLVLIALLIIPQTRKPIQIELNRIFSSSPSEVTGEKRRIQEYEWQLRNLAGERVNFEEARGEVAVVNFWATWCPPCIAEMPSFQALYEDYGDKVSFYFVSSEEPQKLQQFINKRGYSLPVYLPLSTIPDKLKTNSLPTTYVLGRSGEIVVEKTGSADWDSSTFRKLLDRLLQEQF